MQDVEVCNVTWTLFHPEACLFHLDCIEWLQIVSSKGKKQRKDKKEDKKNSRLFEVYNTKLASLAQGCLIKTDYFSEIMKENLSQQWNSSDVRYRQLWIWIDKGIIFVSTKAKNE